jgi:hypothetical protein
MFTATKFVAAGAIVATFGGFLFASGMLTDPQNAPLPPGASATVSAVATETATEAVPTVAVTDAAIDVPGTIVMGEPDAGLSAAGWSQVGSAPYANPDGSGFGELRDLHVVGDRLVAMGSDSPDADAVLSRDAVYTSTDGRTWEPLYLPGNDPVLEDMAATDDGLIIGGLDRLDGERTAKLWSSADGLEWVEVSAPDGPVISQIVSAQDPLAVRVNDRLLQLEDDGTWTNLNRIPNSQILRGPSGYITWQGGGQDRRFQLSMIHQAELDGEIREIGLPGRLGRGSLAQIGVQLFVVGDQWVMVPDGTETPIYVSNDGFEWQEVPRPDRMLGGFVTWMGTVGDELQAFGIQDRRNGSASGIWTIDLGSAEPAPFEVLAPEADNHFGDPVAFADGLFATGTYIGGGNGITTWQHAAGE